MKIPVTVTRSALAIKECPLELANSLAFVRNRVSFGGGDLENVPERVCFAQYDAQTKLCRTYPNALHLVQAAAHKIALRLEIQDRRLRPPLDFDRIGKTDHPSEIYQLFKTVDQSASSGLIIVPSGSDRTEIVSGLVRLLPQHFKILVTADGTISALRIHETLALSLVEEKIGLHVKHQSARSRIIVTHLDALTDFERGDLAYSGYALRDFDAWICDEAHRVAEPDRLGLLSQFRTIYSWGLTATPVRADNSHQLLSVIFGPVLCSLSREKFALQTANSQAENPAARIFVFPLPAPSIAADLRLHEKVRIAYLKNPALVATLRGIDASLPETARVMALVDSIRLGIILHRQLPHYVLLDSNQSAENRRSVLDELRAGKVHRAMLHAHSDRIDLPDFDYVIDCTFASNVADGGARRTSADGGQHANRVMLLCLGCEQFFNDGVAKLRQMNALEWEVMFMFDRKLAEHLPFAQAPLLPELGTFPER